MKVTELTQTCVACPSQWEGKLEDGRMVYIRYRFGWLDVRISDNPTNDIFEAVRGRSIYNEVIGDDLSGTMSAEQMQLILEGILEFSHTEKKEVLDDDQQ